MKTYSERTASIRDKVQKEIRAYKRRKKIIISGISCFCVIITSLLFMPYNKEIPSFEEYKANDYYKVIQKLGAYNYEAPKYDNAFEQYVLGFFEPDIGGEMDWNAGAAMPEESPEVDMDGTLDFNGALPPTMSEETAPGDVGSTNGGSVEVTDNQVEGVGEGDIIKRTDKYIFYLHKPANTLIIYSIAKEESKEVGRYTVEAEEGYKSQMYGDQCEMFLSKDGKNIIIISAVYCSANHEKMVNLISLDVSDPGRIEETGRSYLSGSYLSSRLVGDELLIMTHYRVNSKNMDFDNPETFVPQYGEKGSMECVNPENIACPDRLDNSTYTVVCKVQLDTLAAKDTGAFLSYVEDVYVSKDSIYAFRSFEDREIASADVLVTDRNSVSVHATTMSEIVAMNYSGDGLKLEGSVKVRGKLKDQYSLDQYVDEKTGLKLLRVVTEDRERSYIEHTEERNGVMSNWIHNSQGTTNANLYCIDLSKWEVISSLEKFAVENETVESVRFAGNYAYVCTALVTVELTDPVFFIDMSDIYNMGVKDTGTIDGYSSSLVNFGDYLLGIGYGANRSILKIEVYEETETGVQSIASYEVQECDFSEDYKSYLIDREGQRVGLGYNTVIEEMGVSDYKSLYVLLQFDGYDLVEAVNVELNADNSMKRGVIIDGYIYIMGEGQFVVEKL